MIRLCKSKSGATAIEYSLIAALIALVIVSALGAIGPKVATPFNTISSKL